MYEPEGVGHDGADCEPPEDFEAGGQDLGLGKFQFDFEREEDIDGVLKIQLYHFVYLKFFVAR